MSDKFEVFVGNLTFNTTEEQLKEKFSFVGPVKGVRVLFDKDTGRPKGFAFVEYFDTNTALSAIRHMDQTDLNGRKLKVGYPERSNLKQVAKEIGQYIPEADHTTNPYGATSAASRQQIEANLINSLKLHEAWDLLDAMKRLVAEDNNRGQKAKAVLENNPQLIHALCEIHKRLGITLPKNLQEQPLATQPTSQSAPAGGESKENNEESLRSNSVDVRDQRSNFNDNDGYFGQQQQQDFYDQQPRQPDPFGRDEPRGSGFNDNNYSNVIGGGGAGGQYGRGGRGSGGWEGDQGGYGDNNARDRYNNNGYDQRDNYDRGGDNWGRGGGDRDRHYGGDRGGGGGGNIRASGRGQHSQQYRDHPYGDHPSLQGGGGGGRSNDMRGMMQGGGGGGYDANIYGGGGGGGNMGGVDMAGGLDNHYGALPPPLMNQPMGGLAPDDFGAAPFGGSNLANAGAGGRRSRFQ